MAYCIYWIEDSPPNCMQYKHDNILQHLYLYISNHFRLFFYIFDCRNVINFLYIIFDIEIHIPKAIIEILIRSFSFSVAKKFAIIRHCWIDNIANGCLVKLNGCSMPTNECLWINSRLVRVSYRNAFILISFFYIELLSTTNKSCCNK